MSMVLAYGEDVNHFYTGPVQRIWAWVAKGEERRGGKHRAFGGGFLLPLTRCWGRKYRITVVRGKHLAAPNHTWWNICRGPPKGEPFSSPEQLWLVNRASSSPQTSKDVTLVYLPTWQTLHQSPQKIPRSQNRTSETTSLISLRSSPGKYANPRKIRLPHY